MAQEDRFRLLQAGRGYYIYDYDQYTLVKQDGEYVTDKLPNFYGFLRQLNIDDRIKKGGGLIQAEKEEG
jgi:hypothetical protein